MTEQLIKYDPQGIARNQNGFPAYCFFINKYCLKPYCLKCSSYQPPRYPDHPAFDADKDLFEYLLNHPNLFQVIGSATKQWFELYKKNIEKQLREAI